MWIFVAGMAAMWVLAGLYVYGATRLLSDPALKPHFLSCLFGWPLLFKIGELPEDAARVEARLVKAQPSRLE